MLQSFPLVWVGNIESIWYVCMEFPLVDLTCKCETIITSFHHHPFPETLLCVWDVTLSQIEGRGYHGYLRVTSDDNQDEDCNSYAVLLILFPRLEGLFVDKTFAFKFWSKCPTYPFQHELQVIQLTHRKDW